MNFGSLVFSLVLLFVFDSARAQASALPMETPRSTGRRMYIEPSSTTVSLGKASLIVTPLTRTGHFYVGDYQLKVVPYFFKNENGTLKLDAPDDVVRKLLGGTSVKFTGKATNNKNFKVKVITGEAMPSTNDKGRLLFSVETDNGKMQFKTSYHFGE
jgi:hypothetical protein